MVEKAELRFEREKQLIDSRFRRWPVTTSVVSGPSLQAVGESIRVRRCAPRRDYWARGSVRRIVARALIRGEPVALGRVDASCFSIRVRRCAPRSNPWGARGGCVAGPNRSVILVIDDSVFGVVELSAVSGGLAGI
jgi:hypothetical protein